MYLTGEFEHAESTAAAVLALKRRGFDASEGAEKLKGRVQVPQMTETSRVQPHGLIDRSNDPVSGATTLARGGDRDEQRGQKLRAPRPFPLPSCRRNTAFRSAAPAIRLLEREL